MTSFSQFLFVEQLIAGLTLQLNETIVDDLKKEFEGFCKDDESQKALSLLLAFMTLEKRKGHRFCSEEHNGVLYSDKSFAEIRQYLQNCLNDHKELMRDAKITISAYADKNQLAGIKNELYKFFSRLPATSF